MLLPGSQVDLPPRSGGRQPQYSHRKAAQSICVSTAAFSMGPPATSAPALIASRSFPAQSRRHYDVIFDDADRVRGRPFEALRAHFGNRGVTRHRDEDRFRKLACEHPSHRTPETVHHNNLEVRALLRAQRVQAAAQVVNAVDQWNDDGEMSGHLWVLLHSWRRQHPDSPLIEA